MGSLSSPIWPNQPRFFLWLNSLSTLPLLETKSHERPAVIDPYESSFSHSRLNLPLCIIDLWISNIILMKFQANNLANVDKLWIKPITMEVTRDMSSSAAVYLIVWSVRPAMWAAPLTQSSREGGHRIWSTVTFSDGLIFQYPLSPFLSNSKKRTRPQKRMLLSHPSKTESHYSISQTSWFFWGMTICFCFGSVVSLVEQMAQRPITLSPSRSRGAWVDFHLPLGNVLPRGLNAPISTKLWNLGGLVKVERDPLKNQRCISASQGYQHFLYEMSLRVMIPFIQGISGACHF